MRSPRRGALPVNKMASWLSALSLWDYTQICAVHGTVSLPGKGDGAGELQLWHCEIRNESCVYATKTAGHDELVCELLMFYSFTSKSALTKSQLY